MTITSTITPITEAPNETKLDSTLGPISTQAFVPYSKDKEIPPNKVQQFIFTAIITTFFITISVVFVSFKIYQKFKTYSNMKSIKKEEPWRFTAKREKRNQSTAKEEFGLDQLETSVWLQNRRLPTLPRDSVIDITNEENTYCEIEEPKNRIEETTDYRKYRQRF